MLSRRTQANAVLMFGKQDSRATHCTLPFGGATNRQRTKFQISIFVVGDRTAMEHRV
jgi:hypothetical protein